MQVFLYEPVPTIRATVVKMMAKAEVKCVTVEKEFFGKDTLGTGKSNLSTKAIMIAEDESTVEFIQALRGANCLNPVIVVLECKNSARATDFINAGADDVVIRPFSCFEIVARINAIVRRSFGHVSPSITIGDITAYFDGRDPEINGERLRLSHREHAIFTHLALQHGRVITKESIYEAVYGMLDNQPFDKVIDVYICKLRKKIEQATGGKQYIETVYGRGYKLSDPEDTRHAKRLPIGAPHRGDHAADFVAA